jgi:hypothetical protein
MTLTLIIIAAVIVAPGEITPPDTAASIAQPADDDPTGQPPDPRSRGPPTIGTDRPTAGNPRHAGPAGTDPVPPTRPHPYNPYRRQAEPPKCLTDQASYANLKPRSRHPQSSRKSVTRKREVPVTADTSGKPASRSCGAALWLDRPLSSLIRKSPVGAEEQAYVVGRVLTHKPCHTSQSN